MGYEVYIRADGNSTVGLGHLTRCMALACMIEEYFPVTFYCIDIPELLQVEIQARGFGLQKIEHEEEFFLALTPGVLVVLDGYGFNGSYTRAIKDQGALLVCVDDLHDRDLVADLVINHAPGVVVEDYRLFTCHNFALGPAYALLRPRFLSEAREARTREKLESVLVCFGGADPHDYTSRVTRVVMENPGFKAIKVVTGSAYLHLDAIKLIVGNDPRIEHHHAIGVDEMLAMGRWADLAIVPSSGILLEMLACGCRVISGYYTGNQTVIYQQYLSRRAFIDAGGFSADEVRSAIETAFQAPRPEGRLIDGRSGKRVLSWFLYLASTLREAQLGDARLLLDWANDPSTREQSIRKDFIPWEDHITWFKGRLSSGTTRFFLLEWQGVPVGQVRFDLQDGEWVISSSVGNDYRGKGFGKVLLQKGMEAMQGQRFKALVKEGNAASDKVFRELGFEEKGKWEHEGSVFRVYRKG